MAISVHPGLSFWISMGSFKITTSGRNTQNRIQDCLTRDTKILTDFTEIPFDVHDVAHLDFWHLHAFQI